MFLFFEQVRLLCEFMFAAWNTVRTVPAVTPVRVSP
jgi:hypothetical protein